MKSTHSPLIILALWLIAIAITSLVLHSCEKSNVMPGRDCPNNDRDTTVTLPDTVAQQN